jgi:hypothetical protein
MSKKPKEVIGEVKKTIQEIAREGEETRREVQYLLHALKVTPLRNIFWDEVRYRRPLMRLKRIIRGEE